MDVDHELPYERPFKILSGNEDHEFLARMNIVECILIGALPIRGRARLGRPVRLVLDEVVVLRQPLDELYPL